MRMQCTGKRVAIVLVVTSLLACSARAAPPEAEPDAWVAAMRDVHARFSGQAGDLALFGDSITVSLAFWAPLSNEPRGASPRLAADWKLVRQYQRPECWRGRRGPEFGNEGRMTVRWAHENIDAWLAKLNPEVAVIMFGTNDLTELDGAEYETRLRQVAERCLARGTIAILTTIPPRHGLAERSADFAGIVRKLSRELKVPLVEYHAEVLKRRPDDWDGALEKFRDAPGDEYNVPTLIARDGVHPSNPRDFQDFSERSLSHNGYALRSALTLSTYADVIRRVLQPAP